MCTTRVNITADLVTDVSDNILKYHLGELDLEIDLTRTTNHAGSGASLQPQSKSDPVSEAPDNPVNLDAPFRWFPELKTDSLQFDEAFNEDYLLGHVQFGRMMTDKMSFFFEGNPKLTGQMLSRPTSPSGF